MIFEISNEKRPSNYRLLSGGVTPRPIAWISTRSADGIDNLAPYSFFTVASCEPPVLMFTQVTPTDGLDKDTLRNLLETGECVVNIVSANLVEGMNQTSAGLAHTESEFSFANIEACNSHNVKAKSVMHSPIRYECKLREVQRIGELPAGGSVVMLDVVAVYVNDALWSDAGIDPLVLDTVGKLGGDFFSLTEKKIALKRP